MTNDYCLITNMQVACCFSGYLHMRVIGAKGLRQMMKTRWFVYDRRAGRLRYFIYIPILLPFLLYFCYKDITETKQRKSRVQNLWVTLTYPRQLFATTWKKTAEANSQFGNIFNLLKSRLSQIFNNLYSMGTRGHFRPTFRYFSSFLEIELFFFICLKVRWFDENEVILKGLIYI